MILDGKEFTIKDFDDIYDDINMVPTTINIGGRHPYLHLWCSARDNVCEPLCALIMARKNMEPERFERLTSSIKYKTIDAMSHFIAANLPVSRTYIVAFCSAMREFDQALTVETKFKDAFDHEQFIMGFDDGIEFRSFYG